MILTAIPTGMTAHHITTMDSLTTPIARIENAFLTPNTLPFSTRKLRKLKKKSKQKLGKFILEKVISCHAHIFSKEKN